MASLSDLDTSSESEYDSGQDSISEIDEDTDNETLEPERNAADLEGFENAPWNPTIAAKEVCTQIMAVHAHCR